MVERRATVHERGCLAAAWVCHKPHIVMKIVGCKHINNQ